jgi:purine-binding chemotaxis protein CheW
MSEREDRNEFAGSEVQLVSFKLGKETFAVNVDQVREIGKVEQITHIPKMPNYVEGVMNLRGQITTIIDLRMRFGITGEGGRTAQSRIIVAEIGENQLGIIVDSVQDVTRVAKQSISPPPKTVSKKVDTSFLTGICKLPDRLIMLLDLSKLLSDEEMEHVLEQLVSREATETLAEA